MNHRYQTETQTFTITAAPNVMKRFKRFLALLHYNAAWGHSATFAMPLDGDGSERFKVHDFKEPKLADDVELIGSVGYRFEVALDDCCKLMDAVNPPHFWLSKDGKLTRDGVLVKERHRVGS